MKNHAIFLIQSKSILLCISVCFFALQCSLLNEENEINQGHKLLDDSGLDSIRIIKEGICSDCEGIEYIGIITNEDDYNAFLKLVNQENDTNMEVDFSEKIVIGAYLGERITSGYSVAIRKIDMNTIEVIETQPGPNCGVDEALTYPYIIVSTQKSSGKIEIQKSIKTECNS